MRKLGFLAPLAALLLSACGGGTSFTTPPGSSSGGNTSVTAIALSTTVTQIPSDGSQSARIVAIAKNSANAVVPGVAITFGATSGAIIPTQTTIGTTNNVAAGTTDSNGEADALVSTAGDSTLRTITASASSGTAKATVNVAVVGTKSTTLALVTSSTAIPSNGSKPATITAKVLDANNNAVPNVVVTFAADTGNVTPVQTTAGAAANVPAGTTDAGGYAAATVNTNLNPTNRTITVTATEATTSSTVQVTVNGTQISVAGPNGLSLNGSGTYSIALVDSGSNAIAGQTVSISSAAGNTVTPTTVTTDQYGHGTFTLTGINAGTDKVSVTAAGTSATVKVSVSPGSIVFTSPTLPGGGAVCTASGVQCVNLNTPQTVTAVWTNAGVPVANSTVNFATTRGVFSNGSNSIAVTTDGTGTAATSISANNSGLATIDANAGTGAAQVSAQDELEFIATTPATVDLQASPSTVQPQNSSTITATVWDANQNLVANQVVDFQLTDSTGGSLSTASVQTDTQGQAQTVYTATTTSSKAGGVVVTGIMQNFTGVTGTVALTVAGQSVFLSLGTGNQIKENTPTDTQFIMPWVIQAVDAGGNPVPNVPVTLTVHSLPQALAPHPLNANGNTTAAGAAYAKGAWYTLAQATLANGTSLCNAFAGQAYCQIISYTPSAGPNPQFSNQAYCYNEDEDGSGILHSPSEDINGNGRLDPGDVATVSPEL